MTNWQGAPPEGDDDVGTKPALWRPIADAMGGFDLDPAAGAETVQIADERFTKADDGLTQPWHGCVWLNPPFSEKDQWYTRLVDQYNRGNVSSAVAIAPTDLSADWAQHHFATADIFAFLDGRNHYTAAGNSPSFATVVGVWNPTERVRGVLRRKGILCDVDHPEEQRKLTAIFEQVEADQ